jgi:hypothetical protein
MKRQIKKADQRGKIKEESKSKNFRLEVLLSSFLFCDFPLVLTGRLEV